MRRRRSRMRGTARRYGDVLRGALPICPTAAVEGSTLTFTVSRAGSPGESVAAQETVDWSANGQSGTVTFAAGTAAAAGRTFTVGTTDNNTYGTASADVTATISDASAGTIGTSQALTALSDGDEAPDLPPTGQTA